MYLTYYPEEAFGRNRFTIKYPFIPFPSYGCIYIYIATCSYMYLYVATSDILWPQVYSIFQYFLFKKLTHHYTYIQNPTIQLQLSSNCHQWPTSAFQTYPVTKLSLTKLRLSTKQHLKIADTKQHWNSRNRPRIQDKI